MVTKRLYLGDTEETLLLCGEHDSNLKLLEKRWGVQIFARASALAVRGETRRVDQAVAALEDLRQKIHDARHEHPHTTPPTRALAEAASHKSFDLNSADAVWVSPTGKSVRVQTEHQRVYVDAIQKHDMVLAVGPAGTGKTFLAVACALKELFAARVSRIVLSRPVVEAGEKLGFLPGDFYDKVNPYIKPLYDAFQTLMGPEKLRAYREDETIEIAPLAYMRGRTLDNAFVILDEAQNTTPEQMKMFLTRMGSKSKVVITGDVTQIDLDFKQRSGFVESLKILKDVPEVSIVELTEVDVVRHPLVRKILKAYEAHEKSPQRKSARNTPLSPPSAE